MNDMTKDGKHLKNKAGKLYDTAKDKITDTYNETKDKADEMVDQISSTASDLYESGQEHIIQVEEYLEECVSSVAKSVRAKPLTSLMIAGGIGYLIGKLSK